MNVDAYHLPCQTNGDSKDQLNRVGMVSTAEALTIWTEDGKIFARAIDTLLQPEPGVFKRSYTDDPYNVSADQIIPIISYYAVEGKYSQSDAAFWKMMGRFGFAQNIHDGLGENKKVKIPDLMIFRAMPMFARASKNWKWTAWIFDLYLPVVIVSDWIYYKTNKDPADINVLLATMTVSIKVYPTWLSRFSAWLWPKLRPDIYGAMVRYHRAEMGGNPEVAELWKPIIEENFK